MPENVNARWTNGNLEFFDKATGTTLFTIKAGEVLAEVVKQPAIVDLATANATLQTAAYVQADVQSIATLTNGNKAKINDILAKLRLANIITT